MLPGGLLASVETLLVVGWHEQRKPVGGKVTEFWMPLQIVTLKYAVKFKTGKIEHKDKPERKSPDISEISVQHLRRVPTQVRQKTSEDSLRKSRPSFLALHAFETNQAIKPPEAATARR
jgi:hypothetical protein